MEVHAVAERIRSEVREAMAYDDTAPEAEKRITTMLQAEFGCAILVPFRLADFTFRTWTVTIGNERDPLQVTDRD